MTRARVGVLISGRGSNMAALLYASRAEDCPYQLALVASNDPEAPGLALAQAEGVPTFASDHRGVPRAEHDARIDAALRDARCEYIALAGYMRLLSPGFVQGWAGRMLNIHPSLLPAFPGLDTHARALEAGVKLHGCTVHLVTEAMDEGPILAQAAVPVLPGAWSGAGAGRP